MSAKLLTEHHLEFLSLKGGCTGLSESTLVKMPHCWKSLVVAHIEIRKKKFITMFAHNCDLSGPRPLVKNFLISQPKHMLWVLKLTVSMRRFF